MHDDPTLPPSPFPPSPLPRQTHFGTPVAMGHERPADPGPVASEAVPATREPLFHLALRLAGERCLVVGAGPVAVRKAASLLDCGASVTVVALEVSSEMELLALDRAPAIAIEHRAYRPGEAAAHRLVITATGVPSVDRSVYRDAEAAGVLVNSADDPQSCSFLVPAVIRSGDVSVGVSTGGVSPFLAGWVARRIAAVVGPEVAVLVRLVGDVRLAVRAAGISTEDLDWDGLVNGCLWPILDDGGPRAESLARAAADDWIAGCLRRSERPAQR